MFPPDEEGFIQWSFYRRRWSNYRAKNDRLCPFKLTTIPMFIAPIPLLEEPETERTEK